MDKPEQPAFIEVAKVKNQRRLKGEYRLLDLDSTAIAAAVQPGQFVHLRVPRLASSVLRRPFSVFKAQPGRLSILYKNIGQGTQAMTELRPGDKVNILGPLGNGFPPPRTGRYPLLVAGGYGMAALYLTAKRSSVKGVVFVGGATADDILCADDFRRLNWDVRIATEDGSAGQKGLVTRILDRWLKTERRGREIEFFACGPNGMLQAVCKRAIKDGWRGWISMDRHMGCGLGACLACVQKVRQRNAAGSETWIWARVCTEGPVFECRDILWENED